MHADDLDAMARFIARGRSRRGALASILGGTIGLLGFAGDAAKKKGKKGGKGKKGSKGKKSPGNGPRKPPVDPGDGTNVALDPEEQVFFNLLNGYRAANGLAALVHQAQLAAAAEGHSQDMASRGYFDHLSPEGVGPEARILAQGYNPSAWYENIAAGNASGQETFTQWQNSPEHNTNMLRPQATETGIGRAYNASSQYGWYWTNVLADRN